MQHIKIKTLILLSVLAMSSLLSGCVGIFVAGAAAGGAVIYDRRTAETIVTDKNIAFRAGKAVAQDPLLHNQSHVEFSSFNRILLVTGQVPDEERRQKVLAIARAVPKVRRVYDQLSIATPNDITDRSQDGWVTAKIKSVMIATEGLHSSQIKVITEDGVVYLMGLVTRSQAEIATDIAQEVHGVKRVVKLFEYEA